jgi:glucose-6-phosphate isomerase
MNIKHILVIGIGGSYVGIRAAVDMCCGSFDSTTPELI